MYSLERFVGRSFGFFQTVFAAKWCVLCLTLLLSACSSLAPAPVSETNSTANNRLIPSGFFAQRAKEEIRLATPRIAPAKRSEVEATATPIVWLYVSQASQTELTKAGWAPQANTRPWETFLRKYKIPMSRIATAEEIDKIPAQGVLILPSTVALSDPEKQAIRQFRQRGGSLLSTWLSGVRKENGEWVGFDFMEQVLDVRVAGNTEETNDDNFIIVHGDNPVFHLVPAGTRVWMDRLPHALPLRLTGKNEAAQIMDWSRTFAPDRKTGLVSFNEKPVNGGRTSRIVTLGYPEPACAAADPKLIDLLAHSALTWLIRQPDAYVAAWPHPYQSSALMSIQAAEVLADVDFDFLTKFEEKTGGRASIYVHGDNIARSAPVVQKLQARGHEIAYLGDKFEGFKNQSLATQAQRLEAMRQIISGAGVKIGRNPGFAAPLDDYDANTVKLLSDQHMGHFISFMEASDARTPFFANPSEDVRRTTVVLPRTIRGPEDATQESDDPDAGLQSFLEEFDLNHRMGALSVIRVPSQTLLTPEQREKLQDHLQAKRQQIWFGTGGQIAQWWRDRSRISTKLTTTINGLMLEVTVVGAPLPKEMAAIWINLPQMGNNLRLSAPDPSNPLPPIEKIDVWRSAILLQELVPGEYQWLLHFDPPRP